MKNKSQRNGKQTINLNSLTKQQLIDIIIRQDNARLVNNKIQISDFAVETTESLIECEDSINRLIAQHKTFVELRKDKLNFERSVNNMYG